MRRHHKNANVRKHRGNPHGNAPEYIQPPRRNSNENLRQSVRPGMSEDAMRNKQ